MKIFVKKSKGLIVFVKNKLISFDTISPILLELKEHNNISSTIVVFDQLAHEGLNNNIVLRDLMNFTGRELFISRGISNKVFRSSIILVSLIGLFFKFIMGHKIIHFGALNSSPLKYIFFFNRKNIFFAQQDSYRHTWSQYGHLLKQGLNNKSSSPVVGNNIIAFNDKMDGLDEFYKTKDVFLFGETRTRKIWLDYCIKNSNYYLNKYHSDIDFSRGCIVFILSTFIELKYYINPKNSLVNLFHETIKVLSSFNVPVLIKPHVFTDLDIVNKVVNNNKNMHITYIHPTILALNSTCFIANIYSTTFADAHSLGLPTIEYSDYPKDLLEASNGKSLGYEYVEYFINNDQILLKETITNVLLQPKMVGIEGNRHDDSGLLKKLSE